MSHVSSKSLPKEKKSSSLDSDRPYQHLRAWIETAPFVLVHLSVFAVFWTGLTWQAVAACAALFFARLFGVTAGYHRYFSHRSYKTSRTWQFILAVLAESSAQKGILWWAAHHRRHHRESDTENDVHSPKRRGFWYAHLGWIFDNNDPTDLNKIRDFAKYPELVWLNKYYHVPPFVLACATLILLGWPGLVVGFMVSTVLLWHTTFSINSLSHMMGRARFPTGDESKNSAILALITMGEGWHNNHHYYMTSTRQGFYWWEIDITYYLLKVMRAIGIVWDLRAPPKQMLEEGRRLA